MRKQNLLKKTKRAARTAVCMLLCIASLAYLNTVPANASEASYQGYYWTRIDSQDEFLKFAHGGLASSDGLMATGKEYEPGANYDSSELMSRPSTDGSDWFRVMMLYGDNDQCFISGNSSCNSNESFLGQRARVSYGIDPSKKTFKTVSGLNTPYIKYVKKDGDNGCNRYYMRFSEEDQLGSIYWTMYCKWYGISYHSAARCKFERPGRSVDNWKDNANWWSFQSFQWSGSKVRVFYNIDSTPDRGWEWWNDGEIECTQGYDDSWFKLYIGVKCPVTVVEGGKIEPGRTTSWNDAIITGGEVTVPYGATLVFDGISYNNGCIYVDGGTVVIRGVLDVRQDPKNPFTENSTAGKIEVNNGLLIVEDTGTLITRNPYPSAACVFGRDAHVDINGVAVFTQGFTMESAFFRAGYGSMVCVGVIPNDTVSQSSYSKAWVHSVIADACYLSSLCSNNDKASGSIIKVAGSSLLSNGVFYVNPGVKIECSQYEKIIGIPLDGSFSAYVSTNIYAPISSMMSVW